MATKPPNTPRARSALYSARAGVIVVHLDNGATFAFPPNLVTGLDATPEQLGSIETTDGGTALHWPALGTRHTLDVLLDRAFGTGRRTAARAGRGTSPAKAAAARANGAKGGRPRKATQARPLTPVR